MCVNQARRNYQSVLLCRGDSRGLVLGEIYHAAHERRIECINYMKYYFKVFNFIVFAHACNDTFPVGYNSSEVRLIGGDTTRQGRVEIWYNSQWNTVCDDYWDISDAIVVCQQLGYRGAVTAHQSAHFGQGSGQILLDDLQCTGREASLLECSHRGINVHDCGHSEDASVTCECKMLSLLGYVLTSVI